MAVCCDLEVDVNGQETFMVDKVQSFSCFALHLHFLFWVLTNMCFSCVFDCEDWSFYE